jgi:hypothetical protein
MANAFISALVAACLGLAALHKWRNLKAFRQAMAEFSLLRRVPRHLRSPMVRLVPLTEAAIATLLVIPQTDRLASLLAIGLGLAFVVVVAFDSRPTIAHCGCWGVASADVPKSFHLARSIVLLVAAIGAAATAFLFTASDAWDWMLELEAFALTAPFALFLLELPWIGQIVVIQRVSRGVHI